MRIEILALLAAVGCGSDKSNKHPAPTPTKPLSEQVAAIAEANCIKCHSEATYRNKGVVLKSVDEVAADSRLVTKGSPEESLVYTVLTSGKMPPRNALELKDIQTVEAWIKGLKP